MNMQDDQLHRISRQLDKIDLKLDNHLDRLSRAEEAIVWMKSHIKIMSALGVAALASFGGIIVKLVIYK